MEVIDLIALLMKIIVIIGGGIKMIKTEKWDEKTFWLLLIAAMTRPGR